MKFNRFTTQLIHKYGKYSYYHSNAITIKLTQGELALISQALDEYTKKRGRYIGKVMTKELLTPMNELTKIWFIDKQDRDGWAETYRNIIGESYESWWRYIRYEIKWWFIGLIHKLKGLEEDTEDDVM